MGKYWVIEEQYLIDLIKKVEGYMKLGWKPQGGVCTGTNYFYQAIVRG